MTRTSYYSDQDFERYMARSERERKVQFYVWLGCSFLVHPMIYHIILTDDKLSFNSRVFLIVVSLIALICLIGLWYCYWQTKRSIEAYHQMKREEQAEANALLDEIETERGRKLNDDY